MVGTEPDPEASSRRSAGRPRKEPFDVREERLLDEAVAAFAEVGASASLELIAGRAGINKALVYQHFESKDALFAAAVRRERDRLVAFIAAAQLGSPSAPTPRTGREGVRAGYHAFIDFAAGHPTSLALLRLPAAAALLDGSGRDVLAGALADNIRRLVRRAGEPDRVLPDLLAAMFVGMAGSVIRAGNQAEWDAEAVVDLLTDFTIAGLRAMDPEVVARLEGRQASTTPPDS